MLLSVGQCIVVHPAQYRTSQVVPDLDPAFALRTSGELFDLAFQAQQTLGGDTDAHGRTALGGGSSVEAEAQKFTLGGEGHGALLFIHLQPQFLLHILSGSRQYPLGRASTPDVDVAVIGVADKAVTALF